MIITLVAIAMYLVTGLAFAYLVAYTLPNREHSKIITLAIALYLVTVMAFAYLVAYTLLNGEHSMTINEQTKKEAIDAVIDAETQKEQTK